MIPKLHDSYNNVAVDTVNNSFYMVFVKKEQKKKWKKRCTNIDAYLSAFTLGRTYDGNQPLRKRTQKNNILLKKKRAASLTVLCITKDQVSGVMGHGCRIANCGTRACGSN